MGQHQDMTTSGMQRAQAMKPHMPHLSGLGGKEPVTVIFWDLLQNIQDSDACQMQ